MKYLTRLLSYFKYVSFIPMIAVAVWLYSSFAQSLYKLIPQILAYAENWTIYWFGQESIPAELLDGTVKVINFMNILVNGINYWLPVADIVNVTAVFIYVSFVFVIGRIIIKLVTVGQV